MPLYCDVSLPVPLDTSFTFALPASLQHRVLPGCWVIVPFGPRKLTGVVVGCHDRAPTADARDVLRLVDEDPALPPELRERIEKRPLPRAEIPDLRLEFLETRRNSLFTRRLVDAVRERVRLGEQAIVLLNRRGFSTFVACRSCGARVECRNCSVTLTYHRREQRLLCHYCDYAEPVPSACVKCESEHIYFLGSGSEKVEETLHQTFPRARIARLERDTVRGRNQYEIILSAFRDSNYDVLTGTQMIAQGHDIPNVTLVGVVSADVGLGLPDFRAAERTFQLLTQVAGRAGRGQRPGQVLIQTLNPDHYAAA